MIQKNDWKTAEMPLNTEQFLLELKLTSAEVMCLKEGYCPTEMEDKWFVYCEDDKLYIHRSWTGFCIYIVTLLPNQDMLEVIVNRNPEQYEETNVERDKVMLTIQINNLLGHKSKNAELMKCYIKQSKL